MNTTCFRRSKGCPELCASSSNVARLYAQHTEATGQVFRDGVVDMVYDCTLGQPWLVNAIAEECVESIHEFRYDEPITVSVS